MSSGTAADFTIEPFGARLPLSTVSPPASWIGSSSVWITPFPVTFASFRFSSKVFPVQVITLVSSLLSIVFNTAGIPPSACKSAIVSSPAGDKSAI